MNVMQYSLKSVLTVVITAGFLMMSTAASAAHGENSGKPPDHSNGPGVPASPDKPGKPDKPDKPSETTNQTSKQAPGEAKSQADEA